MNKHVIIKSDFKKGDLPDVKDIHSIDVLQNMDIIKGLDLEDLNSEVLDGIEEALEAIEDVDVQIKLEVKKENKEED